MRPSGECDCEKKGLPLFFNEVVFAQGDQVKPDQSNSGVEMQRARQKRSHAFCVGGGDRCVSVERKEKIMEVCRERTLSIQASGTNGHQVVSTSLDICRYDSTATFNFPLSDIFCPEGSEG